MEPDCTVEAKNCADNEDGMPPALACANIPELGIIKETKQKFKLAHQDQSKLGASD